jgi:hypothetical protein
VLGLIKTGMKAAVAVKVGHMVHDCIHWRQHAEWASQSRSPAIPPAAYVASAGAPADDMLTQLAQLGELKTAGVLTDAEFQAQKARILDR